MFSEFGVLLAIVTTKGPFQRLFMMMQCPWNDGEGALGSSGGGGGGGGRGGGLWDLGLHTPLETLFLQAPYNYSPFPRILTPPPLPDFESSLYRAILAYVGSIILGG